MEHRVTDEVLYQVDGAIAVVTLNRPEKRNALNAAVREGLWEAWRAFESDPNVRVGILTGAGDKAFCAGIDLVEFAETGLGAPPPNFLPVFGENIQITKPTIAPQGLHVLATVPIPATPGAGSHAGEIVPQVWTYERPFGLGLTFRSFVWMQGHTYTNFAEPTIQSMLLRGIAWAAKWPTDALMEVRVQQGRGGRGRGAQ